MKKYLILLIFVLFSCIRITHNPVSPEEAGAGIDPNFKGELRTVSLTSQQDMIILNNEYKNSDDNETNVVFLSVSNKSINYTVHLYTCTSKQYKYIYNCVTLYGPSYVILFSETNNNSNLDAADTNYYSNYTDEDLIKLKLEL